MNSFFRQEAVLKGHLSMPVGYEEYPGEYEIIPRTESQLVKTADKHLSKDIKVEAIPYHEVSNDSGGNTISIG